MRAILRTHGGLGNQLFQVLYGRLYAGECRMELCELHDARYAHAFSRSAAICQSNAPPLRLERAISALRLPKVRQRLTGGGDRPLSVLGAVYLDGYFQEASSYSQFGGEAIGKCLRQLATELEIHGTPTNPRLVHIRLGDFFRTRELAREHAMTRLRNVERSSVVMTNDEELLADAEIAKLMSSKDCRLLSTRALTPEQVLREMASFRRIDANGSTMVFWACVLGGAECECRHTALAETLALFKESFRKKPSGPARRA